MSNGWSGVDPSPVDDGFSATYELATQYRAEVGITISAIRVFSGSSLNLVDRTASIRTMAGAVLASREIDNTLTSGWVSFLLDSPLEVIAGTQFLVEYGTRQFYAATTGGYPRASSDAAVTALSGWFSETIGSLPNNATASFYGVDIVYTVGVAGNEPPEVTSLSLTSVNRTVTAVATVDSDDAVTYTFEWGDGTSTVDADGTAQHTYASDGMYAVMVTATDPEGLHDSAAEPIQVFLISPGANVPQSRLVARHWLLSRPEIGAVQVGKTLQTPYSSWTSDLFITVTGITPITDAYTPLRSHVVQIDVWGRPVTTQRGSTVPLNRCTALAEKIADLTREFVGTVVNISGSAFLDVRLTDVSVVRDPEEMPDREPSDSQVSIGRASMDLQFTYMPIYQ